MWIGGSGGVFAPSLFMGAMLGSAYGAIAHDLLPGIALAAGAYGLVGIGAVFASCARADHRRVDHLRADRRLSDHPAADVRRRRRDDAQ
jgi:Voltage gated chloride channel